MTETTVVRYRYNPDDAWTELEFEQSDISYSLQMVNEAGLCPMYYDVSWTKINQRLVSGNCIADNTVRVSRVFGPVGGIRSTVVNNQWVVQMILLTADGSAVRAYQTLSGVCNTSVGPDPQPKIVSMVPVGSNPDNCGPEKCEFVVLDSAGNLLFRRLEDTCPEVEIDGSCPPGTLECGDCCLDCASTAADVRSLVSMVKQLTNQPLSATQ